MTVTGGEPRPLNVGGVAGTYPVEKGSFEPSKTMECTKEKKQ